MDRIQLLVADGDANDRAIVERDLRMSDAWEVELLEAEDSRQAELVIANAPRLECILLAQNLPDGSGVDVLHGWHERHAHLPCVIVYTRHGDERTAVEAMRAGAFDYLN